MEKKRGRPPKFSVEELRQRLVAEGIKAVTAAGLSRGLEAANLDAAIRAADVPRGSAYRVWEMSENSPQDGFRLAVLLEIVKTSPTSRGLGGTYQAAAEELERQAAALESGDRATIDAAAQALMRVTGAANYDMIRDSQPWRVYRSIVSAATTRPDEQAEVLAAIEAGEQRLLAGYGEFFTYVAELFKLRLRPEYELGEFTVCCWALSEGLANRVTANDYRLVDIPRPTGPDGELELWPLFSVGFEALVRQFFEPDDSRDSS